LVERNVANVEVASSRLVSRSSFLTEERNRMGFAGKPDLEIEAPEPENLPAVEPQRTAPTRRETEPPAVADPVPARR
jgi:hypothetical protein